MHAVHMHRIPWNRVEIGRPAWVFNVHDPSVLNAISTTKRAPKAFHTTSLFERRPSWSLALTKVMKLEKRWSSIGYGAIFIKWARILVALNEHPTGHVHTYWDFARPYNVHKDQYKDMTLGAVRKYRTFFTKRIILVKTQPLPPSPSERKQMLRYTCVYNKSRKCVTAPTAMYMYRSFLKRNWSTPSHPITKLFRFVRSSVIMDDPLGLTLRYTNSYKHNRSENPTQAHRDTLITL